MRLRPPRSCASAARTGCRIQAARCTSTWFGSPACWRSGAPTPTCSWPGCVTRATARTASRRHCSARASARPRLSEPAWLAWSRLAESRAGEGADTADGGQPAGEELPALEITSLDHLVLTVADVDRAVSFYERVLGMRPVTFGAGRRAV